MRYTKTIIILFILLPVLNLQSSNDFIKRDARLTVPNAQASTKIFTLVNPDNNLKFNVTLWIKDWEGKNAFKDLNVTLYDLNKTLVTSEFSNDTGYVDLKLNAGSYIVLVQSRNRTVGYKKINITESEMFTVECWAYNLTVKCVDQENKPLSDHVVFLYDQLVFYTPTNFTVVDNQTGWLINWTKTDGNGIAYFKDVWNGTYRIKVTSGEPIGEEKINLQKPESIVLKCNKTYLTLRFVSWSEPDEPLLNATVFIYNSKGHLVFRDYTDQNGYIRHESIYLDNYTVFVEWMETEVWSGTVNVYQERNLTIRCSVFRLTLRFVDPFGNALPKADVTLRKKITMGEYIGPTLKLKTDETGYVSCLLPSGIYEALCSYGIYSGSLTVNLVSDYGETFRCNLQLNVWLLTFFVASPLAGLTLLLERSKLKKPLEIRKCKNMLSKLESMYKNGLVEYEIYRKLREEYEARLMELGGREMR